MEDNKVTSNSTNTSNQQKTNQTTTLDPYLEPCSYTIRLIERLKSLDISNTLDFNLINKAIYWARKYHGSQMRKSGEPFYTHPLEVAYLISVHSRPTTNTIVTSILHDIIVDNFSWRIAEMTDALTRDRPDGTKLSVEQILANAYAKDDKEVLLIKLMDRVHNIMTIDSVSNEKQKKIALETLNEFITISCYLDNINSERILTELSSTIINKNAKVTIDSEFLKRINVSSSLGKLTFGYK